MSHSFSLGPFNQHGWFRGPQTPFRMHPGCHAGGQPLAAYPLQMPPAPASPRSHTSPPSAVDEAIEFIEPIGKGVFGEVWRCDYKGQPVAAKVTECPTGFRQEELTILRAAQGEHTAKLIDVIQSRKGCAIVMQLYKQSLLDHITQADANKQDKSEKELLHHLSDLLKALDRLHQKKLLFDDLKPDNILVGASGELLLADFGDARDLTKSTFGQSVHELGWGSPNYHARCDVIKQQLTTASDMWMFAQTAIHLWTRTAASTNPSTIPLDLPMKQMFRKCFSVRPQDRPTASEFLVEVQRQLEWLANKPSEACPVSPRHTGRRASMPAVERVAARLPAKLKREETNLDGLIHRQDLILSELAPGTPVFYAKTGEKVEILAVHLDDVEPYYTVLMPNGREKQTQRNWLSLCK